MNDAMIPLDPQQAIASTLDPLRDRPRLLIVDDQPLNIQALYHTFCADHQVFMATGGAAALEVCRTRLPDLVLLDIVMPDMDGYEVCARLKADPCTADIPVIFVTGQDDPASETRGLAAGAVDFITKPINPAVVRARVKAHLTLKRQADQLRELAYVDALTGVPNRRCFDKRVKAEFLRARRTGAPLSLLLIDVDRFKHYNDEYGHQAGDDCLRLVAAAMRSRLHRAGDTLARYGGEEFACILPDTSAAGAMTLALELEQRIRDLNIPHMRSDVARVCTISLGIAERNSSNVATVEDLIAMADAELYRAKIAGRGQVSAPPGEADAGTARTA